MKLGIEEPKVEQTEMILIAPKIIKKIEKKEIFIDQYESKEECRIATEKNKPKLDFEKSCFLNKKIENFFGSKKIDEDSLQNFYEQVTEKIPLSYSSLYCIVGSIFYHFQIPKFGTKQGDGTFGGVKKKKTHTFSLFEIIFNHFL